MNRFQTAMKALDDSAHAGLPVMVSRARETALIEALMSMGEELHVTLEPARIDTNGEVRIVAKSTRMGDNYRGVCGQYGVTFAHWLNQVPVRTGAVAKQGFMAHTSGWCYVNHFDVERLVRAYAAEHG